MATYHFNSRTPGSKIHTEATGQCAKRPCDYRTNAPGAPGATAHAFAHWQAHHILCLRSIRDYGNLSQYSTCVIEIEDTYRRTDWCINQPRNLLPLPMKKTYRQSAASRGLNLPCHDLHHNAMRGYQHEVTDALKQFVWDRIKDAVAKATPGQAHYSEAAVLAALQSLETRFRKLIVARGLRNGGTAASWRRRGSTRNAWWLPFSLASDAVALSRPRRWL